MSEIFGVTTDYLLKDNVDVQKNVSADNIPFENVQTEIVPSLTNVSIKEANDFLIANQRHAFLVALGVGLCIASAISTVCSDIFSPKIRDLSVIFMLLIIAVAVGIFIFSKMSIKKFVFLRKDCLDTEYGIDGMAREKKNHYQSKHTLMIVIGTIFCILSLVPVIVFSSILSPNTLTDEIGTALFLLFIAAGVFMIVRTNIINSGFNILLEEKKFTRNRKISVRTKYVKNISTIYWLIVTAMYFGYSFMTGDWGTSRIIWPVTAILFPVIIIIATAICCK